MAVCERLKELGEVEFLRQGDCAISVAVFYIPELFITLDSNRHLGSVQDRLSQPARHN